MLTVILSKNAEIDFARLSKTEKKKVVKKIRLLQEEPFAGKLLGGELKGWRSLRVWPYRIIYEFWHSEKVVIYRIVHRQKVYK